MNKLVTIIKNKSAHKVGGFVRACFALTGTVSMTLGVLNPQATKAIELKGSGSINTDPPTFDQTSTNSPPAPVEAGADAPYVQVMAPINSVSNNARDHYLDSLRTDLDHGLSQGGHAMGVYYILGSNVYPNNNIGGITPNPPAVSVPWETDALPIIGSTVILGLGLWAKRKLTK